MSEQIMHFDGACPFLTCLEAGPHDHEICPDCGAVRYGNIYCLTCRSHWPDELQRYKQAIEQVGATT